MNILVKIDSFNKLKEIAERYGVRHDTIQYYERQMRTGYRFINLTELSVGVLRTYSNQNITAIRKLKPFIVLGKIKC